MPSLYDTAKAIAFRWLPMPLLAWVRSRHYYRVFARSVEKAEPDRAVALALVEEGDTVVDVGANIGVYTSAFSDRVSSSGTVLSLEPVPDTFKYLSYNVRRKRAANVVLMNVAASDKATTVTMHIPRKKSGVEYLYRARIDPMGDVADESEWSREVRDVTVLTDTLDNLLASYGRIAFIKCDVEGHELECVRGTVNLIQRYSPALLVELSDNITQPGSKAAQIKAILGSSYSTWELIDNQLISVRGDATGCNVFFLTADHIERLRNSPWFASRQAINVD